jgi:hypothetical protein
MILGGATCLLEYATEGGMETSKQYTGVTIQKIQRNEPAGINREPDESWTGNTNGACYVFFELPPWSSEGGRDRHLCVGGKTNNTTKQYTREYYNWMSFVYCWILI